LTDFSQVLAFCVVTIALLAMVSYMVYRRSLEMGHEAGPVTKRLVVFWLGCLAALGVGVYFKHLYPNGLFDVNFTGMAAHEPMILTGGPPSKGVVIGAVGGMVLAALVAWLAVRPLQNPPRGGPRAGGP
jgi:hypothetical protein